MAQLAGIVMIDPSDVAQQNNFFFGGVDNLRWRKPVVPGDVLVSSSAAVPRRRAAAQQWPAPWSAAPCPDPAARPHNQMMRVDVTKFNKRFGICKVAAKAYVGTDLVCDGELTLVMGK